MTHDELIQLAKSVLKPHATSESRLFGDVGAALITKGSAVFTGVAVDTAGWGLCAERSAMAAMITSGEYEVKKIVAVWENDETGAFHVLPPCGICREFLFRV